MYGHSFSFAKTGGPKTKVIISKGILLVVSAVPVLAKGGHKRGELNIFSLHALGNIILIKQVSMNYQNVLRNILDRKEGGKVMKIRVLKEDFSEKILLIRHLRK